MGRTYNADQLALHDKIVSRALAGKDTPDPHPKFIVFGGPMGTGKASTTRLMMKNELVGTDFPPVDVKSTVFIRTSLFTELPVFKTYPNVTHPEKRPEAVKEYNDICFKICEAAKKKGLSVVWLDHAEDAAQMGKITRLLDTYDKSMCGFYATDEWIKASIAMRNRDDGRTFDFDLFQQQKIAFSKNWNTFEGMFDHSILFGFTDPTPPELLKASDYKTICKCEKGGKRAVVDTVSFTNFTQWAHARNDFTAAAFR